MKNACRFSQCLPREVYAFAAEVWDTYFQGQPITIDPMEEVQCSQSQSPIIELTGVERLGMAIGKRTSTTSQPEPSGSRNDKNIERACKNDASSKIMHPCLGQMFDALLLIKPTSIKNEQNFSMSSNFLSKNRKQMHCSTLDDLCLLKSHYCSLNKV